MSEAAAPVAKKPKKTDEPLKKTHIPKLGKPKETKVAVKITNIERIKDAQIRAGLGESAIIQERVDTFAEKVKAGAEFPPVKLMRVSDPPEGYEPGTLFLFDGFHTTAGHEAANKKTVLADVWEGTWALLRFAVSQANREHDSAGLPRTNKDKANAINRLGQYYTRSDIPKAEWPSNREFAELIGVSHQMVNNLDPLGRLSPEKKKERQAKKSPPPATQQELDAIDARSRAVAAEDRRRVVELNEIPFYVKKKGDTANILGMVYGPSVEAAKADFPKQQPNLPPADYILEVAHPVLAKYGKHPAQDPALGGGSPPNSFDWSGFEERLGYLVRGVDAMKDIFALKPTDVAAATRLLNEVATWFSDIKKAHQKKTK